MPVVQLPFSCVADITPKGKRKPRRHLVRRYTDVLVPEYSTNDLPVAIELAQGARAHRSRYPELITRFLSHGNELLLPALDDRGGPLELCRLEAMVGREWTPGRYEHVRFSPGFQALPRVGRRHDGMTQKGRIVIERRYANEMQTPLTLDTVDYVCTLYRYDEPKIEYVDSDERIATAQDHYSRTVVLVEGRLFLQAQEPVWFVRGRGKEVPMLMRHDRPDRDGSQMFFRLDALERALDYVEYPAGTRAEIVGDSGVEIMSQDAVTRIDSYELAKHAFKVSEDVVRLLPHLVPFGEDHPMPTLSERDAEGLAVAETGAVLEEMRKGWETLLAILNGDRVRSDLAAPMEEFLHRVEFERSSGGLIPSMELSAEDIDALTW
jgi:hypothetical protein